MTRKAKTKTEEVEVDRLWQIISTDHSQNAIDNEIERINQNRKRMLAS